MSSLRGRCRKSKKANPYAGHGLDKFALVSAELEAKREKLAAQLDTPLSMVKFAIGSHSKWIPIVLSRSARKGSCGLKKKSTGLVAEDKSIADGSAQKEGKTYVGGLFNEGNSEENLINKAHIHVDGLINGDRACVAGVMDKQRTQLSGFINGNTTSSANHEKIESNVALLNGLITQEQTHPDNLLNEDGAPLDDLNHQNKSPLGGFLGIQQNDLGEIIKVLPASSDTDHISLFEKEAKALQGFNSKRLMVAAWMVSKVSILASNVVFLRWNTKSKGKNTASVEKAPKGQNLDKACTPCAAMMSSSLSPLKKSPSPSAFQTHQVLTLPSPPVRLKTARNSSPSDEAAIAEMVDDRTTKGAFKQQRKCKAKSFLKMRSAPCTPRDSRETQKLFTAARVLPETRVLKDQVTQTDVKDEQSIAERATNLHNVVLRSHLSRVSSVEKAQKERGRRVGQALAAMGLLWSLSGLMMGYISAILGLVCWWYVLPTLRKAVGDKPMVQSHHNSHDTNNNTKALNVKSMSSSAIKQTGSGKYDLESHEYKKKVIMDGLLDREQRSNA